MPINTQHFTAAASILAVGLGVAAVARTMPAAPPVQASVEAGPFVEPTPSKCAKACADIAPWCPNGLTVNCVDMLTRLEREGTVGCADGLSEAELKAIGWCGDSGVVMPLFPVVR